MNTPDIASLPAKWREHADKLDKSYGPGDMVIAAARRRDAAELEAALASPAGEGVDWYISEEGTLHVDFDFKPDHTRQLSLLCKRDGTVAYAAYIDGDRLHGPDAMAPEFFNTIRRLATPEQTGSSVQGEAECNRDCDCVGPCKMQRTTPPPAPAAEPEARGVEGMVLVPSHYAENVGYAAATLEQSECVIDRHNAPPLRTLENLLAAPNPVRAEQPEGKWKLVPFDPTDAMLEARPKWCLEAEAEAVYYAMLAATPAAPSAAVGVDGHASDCALHNEPAMPSEPCNCHPDSLRLDGLDARLRAYNAEDLPYFMHGKWRAMIGGREHGFATLRELADALAGKAGAE